MFFNACEKKLERPRWFCILITSIWQHIHLPTQLIATTWSPARLHINGNIEWARTGYASSMKFLVGIWHYFVIGFVVHWPMITTEFVLINSLQHGSYQFLSLVGESNCSLCTCVARLFKPWQKWYKYIIVRSQINQAFLTALKKKRWKAYIVSLAAFSTVCTKVCNLGWLQTVTSSKDDKTNKILFEEKDTGTV